MDACSMEKTKYLAFLGAAILIGAVAVALTMRGGNGAAGATGVENAGPGGAGESLVVLEGVTIGAPGRSEPYSEEIPLAFPVSGRLRKLYVKEGNRLGKGALLAELENNTQAANCAAARARLREAEAHLEKVKNGARKERREIAKLNEQQAKANYDKLKAGSRPEEIAEAQAQVASAQAAVRSSQARWNDITAMKDSVPGERIHEAQANLDQARQQLRAAEARLQAIVKGPRQEDIKLAELQWKAAKENAELICGPPRREDLRSALAAVELAKAQVSLAEAELEKTRLRAPFDNCTVLEINRRPGEFLTNLQADTVMIVGDISRMCVRAQVDTSDIGQLYIGQRIEATSTAHGKQKFTGVVTKIGYRMGKKGLFTDNPAERRDRRVLEVVSVFDRGQFKMLTSGLRMTVRFLPRKIKKTVVRKATNKK